MPRPRITNEQADALLAPLKGKRVGDMFGKPYGTQGKKQPCILVRWSCGHEVEVWWGNLQQGHTAGCGVPSCLLPKRIAAASAFMTARHKQARLARSQGVH